MEIGGITIEYGRRLGSDLTLATLQEGHDAVFLGMGLAGVNAMALDGEHDAIDNAVDWIATMRQSPDKTDVAVGRDVVVIGGGMTAVDAAVQSKLLGAETVTIAYRRDRAAMPASRYEQDLATSKGVRLLFNAAPKTIGNGSITLARTEAKEGKLTETGEEVTLTADHVLLAIGQTLSGAPEVLALDGGKIAVTGAGRTSVPGIWAGGDCAAGGEDLTVTAVAEGRDAADDIHANLMGGA
jgi:glutamate synthase (NADPH/NADH) small chain